MLYLYYNVLWINFWNGSIPAKKDLARVSGKLFLPETQIIMWEINKKIAALLLKNFLIVLFDRELTFQLQRGNISKYLELKLNAISRITPCRDLVKKLLAVNEFFSSTFNDCPSIWIC